MFHLARVASISRFDMHTAAMNLSSFRSAHRQGHLHRAERIYPYIARMKEGKICIRMDGPDFSDVQTFDFEWMDSIWGNSKEQIPNDDPQLLDRHVSLSHCIDVNLMHCLLAGRSVTGVLHMMNQFPVDWYSKKQSIVETATCGSQFVAARACVEQIIDLRLTLRSLGVPLRNNIYMYGDNDSGVAAKLHKRQTLLPFRHVGESMAYRLVSFIHFAGCITFRLVSFRVRNLEIGKENMKHGTWKIQQ